MVPPEPLSSFRRWLLVDAVLTYCLSGLPGCRPQVHLREEAGQHHAVHGERGTAKRRAEPRRAQTARGHPRHFGSMPLQTARVTLHRLARLLPTGPRLRSLGSAEQRARRGIAARRPPPRARRRQPSREWPCSRGMSLSHLGKGLVLLSAGMSCSSGTTRPSCGSSCAAGTAGRPRQATLGARPAVPPTMRRK